MKILKILETVKNFIKKNKKLVTVVSAMFCAVVLVAGSIAGTIAYLTSQTGTVTNTFTVGKVAITLDEAKVDEYGVAQGTTRVSDKNTYKLIPGKTYTKDPIVHVAAGSEECWIFIKIVNNLTTVEGADTIASQLADKWTVIDAEKGIYAYKTKVNALNAAQDVPTFTTFTVKDGADATALNAVADKTIEVTAYAVQANGFDTAAEAWTATFGAPPTT